MGHRTRSCCFRLIVLCSICLALRVSILENGSLEARPLAGRTVNSGVYGQATVVVSSPTRKLRFVESWHPYGALALMTPHAIRAPELPAGSVL
jgi:hypothetical protein